MSFRALKTQVTLKVLRYAFSQSSNNDGELESFEPIIQRILKTAV